MEDGRVDGGEWDRRYAGREFVTPQAIAAELPGLTVKRAGRVHRPVDTPDDVRQAIDTLVLALRPG